MKRAETGERERVESCSGRSSSTVAGKWIAVTRYRFPSRYKFSVTEQSMDWSQPIRKEGG